MNQFTPLGASSGSGNGNDNDNGNSSGSGTLPPELQTTVSNDEYSELIDYALDLGITNSYMQEGGTAEESFIPPFDLTGV